MREMLQHVAAEAGTPRGLPLHGACRIAKGVMLGVASMHRVSGVVHMDLKPDNAGFMRAGDLGSVVVMDYGVAQQAGAPLLQYCGLPCSSVAQALRPTSYMMS